ncbi:MAG: hypothetical protein M1826_002840 [Phylliscum demangeonii]|nr:MAG: hypothetical protein M1826_002840 [Phylliscum demangeonii]
MEMISPINATESLKAAYLGTEEDLEAAKEELRFANWEVTIAELRERITALEQDLKSRAAVPVPVTNWQIELRVRFTEQGRVLQLLHKTFEQNKAERQRLRAERAVLRDQIDSSSSGTLFARIEALQAEVAASLAEVWSNRMPLNILE